MDASSAETGSVDLSTGKLAFPFDLISLPGDGGLDIKLTAVYSSADIVELAGTWNDDAPTGPLGLGWALPETTIRSERYGTGVDAAHSFLLTHDGRSYPLRLTLSTTSTERVELYEPEGGPFWRLTYFPGRWRWSLVLETGVELRLGGIIDHPDGYVMGCGDSIEFDFSWNGWTGASAQANGRGSQPIVWHVEEVVGPQLQKLNYSYEQDRLFPPEGKHIYRTQSCRLARVYAAGGHEARLIYGKKTEQELPRFDSKSAAMPDRRNNNYLSSITALHDGQPLFEVKFDYVFLNADRSTYTKRLLARVQRVRRASQPLEPAVRFDYYGLDPSDRIGPNDPGCGIPQYVQRVVADPAVTMAGYKLRWPSSEDSYADADRFANDPAIWFGEGQVVRATSDPTEYLVIDGHRHLIPNSDVRAKLLHLPDKPAQMIDRKLMTAMPSGDPFPEVGSPVVKTAAGTVFLRFAVPDTALTILRSVTGPAVMDALGLRWPGDAEIIESVDPSLVGPDISLLEGRLVQATGSYPQYLVISGHRHFIPSISIRDSLIREGEVLTLRPEQLAEIPEGDPFHSSGTPIFAKDGQVRLRFVRRTVSGGAAFGCLKSMMSSSGATTRFRYARKILSQTSRALLDAGQASGWIEPKVFFGPDYVVVTRTDTARSRTLVRIHQWSGTWRTPVDEQLAGTGHVVVQCQAGYVAVGVDGLGKKKATLALYVRSPIEIGRWVITHKEFLLAGPSKANTPRFAVMSSATFCAVLTRTLEDGNVVGRLYRYTLVDGGAWKDISALELDRHPRALFAAEVCNNYVVTVSVRADDSRQPRLWLAYLDRSRAWTVGDQLETGVFIPYKPPEKGFFKEKTEYAIDYLELHARGSYVLVQARSAWAERTGTGWLTRRLYRHFVYNLTTRYRFAPANLSIPDINGFNQAGILSGLLGDVDLVIEATEAHFALIPVVAPPLPQQIKHIYRYDGQDWLAAKLPMSRSAALWNDDLTLAVKKSGFDQAAVLTQFDPTTRQWQECYVATTTDIALIQTILFFVQILLTPIAFLPIPGVAQAILFVVDLGLAAISSYISRFETPGPQGNRYLIVGDKLLYRRADRSFSSPMSIPKAGGTNFVYDQIVPGESHMLYMTSGSEGVLNSVAVFRNGGIFAVRYLESVDGSPRTTEPSTHQPGLNAGSIIVAYPRSAVPGKNDLKSAATLALYWLEGCDIAGPVDDVVVERITVNDGFQMNHTCFDYDNRDVRIEALSGRAIYHKVRVAAGADRFQLALTFGGDEYAFINGVGEVRHPAAVGQLYQTRAIGPGVPETRQIVNTTWTILPRGLIDSAGYARWLAKESETSVTTDGLVETTRFDYQRNGSGNLIRSAPISSVRSWKDWSGRDVELQTDTVFVDQFTNLSMHRGLSGVPAGSIVRKTVGGRETYRTARAITWALGKRAPFYPERTWIWKGQGRPDPLALTAHTAAWEKGPVTHAVSKGVESEISDAFGPLWSRLLSADGRSVIAEVRNASFATGEVLFFSFEPYEDLKTWTVIRPSGQSRLTFLDGDAYAGSRCLLVATGATVETGREQPRMVAAPSSNAYVVSGFFKASAQFWQTQNGQAIVALVMRKPGTGSDEIVIPITLPTSEAPADCWLHFERRIDIAAEKASHGWAASDSVLFVLRIVNDRSAPLLIDCLRFAPCAALMRAHVFHPVTRMAVATLGNGDQTSRIFYRNGDVPLARLAPDGSLAIEISGGPGDRGPPSMEDPNFRLRLSAVGVVPLPREIPSYEAVTFSSPDFGFRVEFRVPLLGLAPRGGNSPPAQTLRMSMAGGVSIELRHGDPSDVFRLEIRGKDGRSIAGRVVVADDIVDEYLVVDCLVVVVGRTLTVVAGRSIVFSGKVEGLKPDVGFALMAPPQRQALASIIGFVEPQLAIEFLDGGGKLRQSQEIDSDSSVLVAETLYDTLGRPSIVTQAVRKGEGARNLGFGFEPELVAERFPNGGAFWASSEDAPMSGAIRNWLELDYACERPYQRTTYERGTSGRKLRISAVGADGESADSSVTMVYQDAADPYARKAISALGVQGVPNAYLKITKRRTTAGPPNLAKVEIADIGGDFLWSGDISDTASFARTIQHESALASDAPPGAIRQVTTLLQASNGPRGVQTFIDRHGRVIEIRDGETGDKRLVYDARGRLRFALEGPLPAPGRLAAIQYTKYDALDRIVEKGVYQAAWNRLALQGMANAVEAPEGTWLHRFTYDSCVSGGVAQPCGWRGTLAEAWARQPAEPGDFGTLMAPIVTMFCYDVYGRLEREVTDIQGLGKATIAAYRYDGRSRLASVRDTFERATTYRYDCRGRIASVGADSPDQIYARHIYAATGALRIEQLGPDVDPITRRTYSYRPQGQLTVLDDSRFFRQMLNYKQGIQIEQEDIEYRTQARKLHGEYSYDAFGQLRDSRGPAHARSARYDTAGNLTSLSTDGSGQTFSYAPASNRLMSSQGAPIAYDDRGNVTSVSNVRIDYDFTTNRPARIATENCNVVLLYDALGRPVMRVDKAGQVTLDQWIRTGDRIARWNLKTPEDSSSFVHSPFGVIARIDQSGTSYVSRDHLGSARVVSKDRVPLLTLDYDVDGRFLADSGSAAAREARRLPFLYTGHAFEPAVRLFDFGARLYAPELGRFLAPDSAGQYGNPYLFVGNNPVNLVDPSGMVGLVAFRLITGGIRVGLMAGIGAAVGAAMGALVGALNRNPDAWDGAGQGAWMGALSGATIGVAVTLATLLRGSFAAARAAYPVILYDDTFIARFGPFEFGGGRLTAEKMAEFHGIPTSRWGDFLVSNTRMDNSTALPMDFDGRIFVHMHGGAGGTLLYRQGANTWKTGSQFAAKLNAGLPSDIGRIREIHMGSCYASFVPAGSRSFTQALHQDATAPGGPIPNLQKVTGLPAIATAGGEFGAGGRIRPYPGGFATFLEHLFAIG